MKQLIFLIGIVALAACGGRDQTTTADTAMGTLTPPATGTMDTTRMADTTMRDTTMRDTTMRDTMMHDTTTAGTPRQP